MVWSVVALRKESVDRNHGLVKICQVNGASLSARRAWIEIHIPRNGGPWQVVALRKESVDRNCQVNVAQVFDAVALRKESVDRNRGGDTHANRYYGRSPQGERG